MVPVLSFFLPERYHDNFVEGQTWYFLSFGDVPRTLGGAGIFS